MKTRFLALFFALTLAGCFSSSSPSPEGAATGSRTAASGNTAPTEEFSLQGGVLAPKPDSERVHQEFWNFAAYYGDAFSKQLKTEEFGSLMLSEGGRLTLPLKVRIARGYSDDSSDVNWIDNQTGLQVRLVHHYTDAANSKLYRFCDTLTVAPIPSGQNAVFTDLDMHQGGSVEVFLADPVDYAKSDGSLNLTPSTDFSSSCVDMTSEAYNAWQHSQIKLGNILLMVPFKEEPVPSTGFGPDQIIVIPDKGVSETPPRPKTAPNIPSDRLIWKQ